MYYSAVNIDYDLAQMGLSFRIKSCSPLRRRQLFRNREKAHENQKLKYIIVPNIQKINAWYIHGLERSNYKNRAESLYQRPIKLLAYDQFQVVSMF